MFWVVLLSLLLLLVLPVLAPVPQLQLLKKEKLTN